MVTRPDAPAGRGRKLVRSPVGAVADEHGIEVLTPHKASDPEFLQRLRELAPDCCPVVAYGALLRPEALAIPRHGWVNLHFSLLPAWRGAAPVQRAIMAGDEVTGATTFRLVPELDAGPVFATLIEPLADQDTAGDVLGRLGVELRPGHQRQHQGDEREAEGHRLGVARGAAGQHGDDDGTDERHHHHQGEQGQGVHWITHRAPRMVTTPVSIVRAYDRA